MEESAAWACVARARSVRVRVTAAPALSGGGAAFVCYVEAALGSKASSPARWYACMVRCHISRVPSWAYPRNLRSCRLAMRSARSPRCRRSDPSPLRMPVVLCPRGAWSSRRASVLLGQSPENGADTDTALRKHACVNQRALPFTGVWYPGWESRSSWKQVPLRGCLMHTDTLRSGGSRWAGAWSTVFWARRASGVEKSEPRASLIIGKSYAGLGPRRDGPPRARARGLSRVGL